MNLKILGPDDPALVALDQALGKNPGWNASLEIVSWPEYRARLMEVLKASQAPYQAVFVPGHVWIPELASAGYLAGLDEYLSDAPPGLQDQYDNRDIISAVYSESCFKGQLYQFPFFSDGHILFYQPEYVTLEAPSGLAVVSPLALPELAAAGHQPSGRYGMALKAHPSEIFLDWLPFLWELGGTIQDEQGQPAFASSQGVEALKLYCSLRQYCPPETHTYGNAEIARVIRQGRAALVTTWGGQAASLYEQPGSQAAQKYAVAVFTHPWNATWGIAVPANQPRKSCHAVVNLLLQALTPDLDRQVTRVAGSPVRRSSYTAGEIAQFPWLAAQSAMLERAGRLPDDPQVGGWLGALYEAVYEAFTGQLEPGAALSQAQVLILDQMKGSR